MEGPSYCGPPAGENHRASSRSTRALWNARAKAANRLRVGSWLLVLDRQYCYVNWRVEVQYALLLGCYLPSTRQIGYSNV
eukprot:3485226-Pyramimonas_sp.AAC.1